MTFERKMTRRALAFGAVALLALGACSDPEEEEEPDVATMRVTIGATVVDFTGGCTPSVSGVTIPTTGAQVSAAFLRADQTPDPLVTAAEFELAVTPESRFARTAAFAGTLSGGAAGQAQVSFALFHKEEMHEDYGPCPLTITVQ